MSKKSAKITREQQYRDALAKDGIRFEDCRVLSFVFDRMGKPATFHYDLMLHKNIVHYLFDAWNNCANVVVPQDEGNATNIVQIAENLGGQRIAPNLL